MLLYNIIITKYRLESVLEGMARTMKIKIKEKTNV